ncbi:AAA family ATPase [Stenomitos frigidus]|uniref:KAP family P-loop domain-containing protein n=1 Tax=Stenomitos frigidus ULC18 TaxID=2107698 RepID=A0A2T1EIR8_9CYAN|nr:AAA family ATPase [Stenomitos frigidus]PSB32647.1 KAP family P-loop domain-containing protein [Stenomitos frigidus ULC18]
MAIDFQKLFAACQPDRSLNLANPDDRPYYIDFSAVRGDKIIRRLRRTIGGSSQSTCQLFSGHVGCGKTTELFRLKSELEEDGYYVVYFECTEDLDLDNVDVTDVLLAIARQASEKLEQDQIFLEPQGFKKFLQDAVTFLQTEIDITGAQVNVPGGTKLSAKSDGKFEFSLPLGIASITAEAKKDKNLHDRLRQYLAPRTTSLLAIINDELLNPATIALRQRNKKGLVVVVDNLDRVGAQINNAKRPQNEYLFIEQGSDLRRLSCHLIYTIPLVLLFTNERDLLVNRLGGGTEPTVLPMVPVQSRDGQVYEEGMRLLRQMVLARAFPELTSEQERLERVHEVFQSPALLDRLCFISGGHVRKLMTLLFSCLQVDDLPLSSDGIESVIRDYRDALLVTVDDDEWKLIMQVVRQRVIQGDEQFKILLPSTFFFEYRDSEGRWFGLNPVLAETREYKHWLEQAS